MGRGDRKFAFRRRRMIRTADGLAARLDEFDGFDGGQCVSLSPPPTASGTPKRVEITLRDIGEGGLWAGDLRTYRVLRLTAGGVREWSFEGERLEQLPGHAISRLEPVGTRAGIALSLDLPTVVRLIADSFACEQLPDVSEVFGPWISDRELVVTVPRVDVPTPLEWVDAIGQEGIEVGWRLYGGGVTPPEQVPTTRYDGWFLERPERVDEHLGGIQVLIDNRASGLTLKIRADSADHELWLASCRSTVRLVPDGEFISGNCRLTAAEWLALLEAIGESPGSSVNNVAIRSSHLRAALPMEIPKGSPYTGWRVRR